MKLALVIGRFQPLHAGHISLIRKAAESADKVLVLIGSANKLTDFKNPFTDDDRLKMLEQEFSDVDNIIIQTVKDYDSDDEWIQEVTSRALNIEEDPTNVALFCNPKDEEWYRRNFLFPVETVDSVAISATEVRTAWYEDNLWTVEEHLSAHVLSMLNDNTDFLRLQDEYDVTTHMKELKTQGHPFRNPMEPVSFAVIMQNGKVLLGKRGGARGRGQWGLCGGFVQNTESTLEASMRETLEEVGLDLSTLCKQGQAVCFAQAVSENLDDLGVRTLGVNYLFVLKPDLEVKLTPDGKETLGTIWIPYEHICNDDLPLFYNHNQIVRQLLSKVGNSK